MDSHLFQTQRPIVVCPLRFELTAVRRAGLAQHVELHCCGPGAAGVEAWAAALRDFSTPRLVILTGLAGSLSPDFKCGSAALITAVIDPETKVRRVPTWTPPRGAAVLSTCSVTSTPHSVPSRQQKLALKRSVDADLVDQESVPFARIADEAGLHWAIVRGISDDLDYSLPAEADRWVASNGRTRLLAVLSSVVARPRLVTELGRLRRDSREALAALAALLKRMLAVDAPEGPDNQGLGKD